MKGAAQRGPAVRKLYTHTSLRLFFALCWFGYFSTYLGRLNLTACIAEMMMMVLYPRPFQTETSTSEFIATAGSDSQPTGSTPKKLRK